ncbi:hypothetical protein PUMCH_002995 [Australozyma saopauloensis]|uniref:DASH complex subunit DAD4 n=1 Tax=Australozyma saopauloensis TaxID=291208 RepID=A0AAX4HAW6_9ASCO|nr:hypothetical protein PUMCH_002995 [[Candida] saopauloensis]
MDNPHKQVQSALFSRIINNMVCVFVFTSPTNDSNIQKNLNEAVHDVNLTLNDISNKNKDTEVLARMWLNYSKSAEYNLEATGQKRDPL